MSEDMSGLINQINNMIKNNEIPDEIRNMMNQFTNSSQTSTENKNTQNATSTSSNDNSSASEFDMATIMKMKKIMDSMKENRNDPRANLLKSLKPYLKESRKEKVDQYIQLLGIGKAFEVLAPLGGDTKK